MAKTTSPVILAGLLFLSLAVTISAECMWCAPKEGATDDQLQKAVDWACQNGADCGEIEKGKSCYKEGDVKAMAGYVFNDYWKKTKAKGGSCDFDGAGNFTNKDPSFDSCKIPRHYCKWCVPKNTSTDDAVQKAMDWACQNGADCDPIQPGKPCRKDGDVKKMAAYVYNDYWTKKKNNGGTCDFDGTGVESDEDPSFDQCEIKNDDSSDDSNDNKA